MSEKWIKWKKGLIVRFKENEKLINVIVLHIKETEECLDMNPSRSKVFYYTLGVLDEKNKIVRKIEHINFYWGQSSLPKDVLGVAEDVKTVYKPINIKLKKEE